MELSTAQVIISSHLVTGVERHQSFGTVFIQLFTVSDIFVAFDTSTHSHRW